MPVFCIDIGNSFAHVGLVEGGRILERADVATAHFAAADRIARAALEKAGAARGISYASVVPAATKSLCAILGQSGLANDCYNLRFDTVRGLCIAYPTPSEIGQDRIANAVAAQELCGAPCVAVSLGTATVFDVISKRGYEGGIIAPGLAIMTDYMHDRTAQLPRLELTESLDVNSAIGRSTVEAMTIGARVGFRGMVKELLGVVLAQMKAEGEGEAKVVTTGGNGALFRDGWLPQATHIPDLGMLGLEIAFRRAKNG
jgi:type III pantothenate kinase